MVTIDQNLVDMLTLKGYFMKKWDPKTAHFDLKGFRESIGR